jgi:phage shock protein C
LLPPHRVGLNRLPIAERLRRKYDENRHVYRRKTPFRYTDAPSEQIKKVQGRMAAAVTRVEAMEQYVASRQYDLNREFSKR